MVGALPASHSLFHICWVVYCLEDLIADEAVKGDACLPLWTPYCGVTAPQDVLCCWQIDRAARKSC